MAKEVSVNADDPGDPTDPVPPVASFTFNANDLSVSFANSSQHDDSSSWNFGDGNSSSDENPSHTYASAGSYQVTLEVTNADGSDSVTETVTVEAPDPDPVPPVASFLILSQRPVGIVLEQQPETRPRIRGTSVMATQAQTRTRIIRMVQLARIQ